MEEWIEGVTDTAPSTSTTCPPSTPYSDAAGGRFVALIAECCETDTTSSWCAGHAGSAHARTDGDETRGLNPHTGACATSDNVVTKVAMVCHRSGDIMLGVMHALRSYACSWKRGA